MRHKGQPVLVEIREKSHAGELAPQYIGHTGFIWITSNSSQPPLHNSINIEDTLIIRADSQLVIGGITLACGMKCWSMLDEFPEPETLFNNVISIEGEKSLALTNKTARRKFFPEMELEFVANIERSKLWIILERAQDGVRRVIISESVSAFVKDNMLCGFLIILPRMPADLLS